MLRILVELHPGGHADFRRTLASMSIGNISDLSDLSNYEVTALEGPNALTGAPARISSFVVEGHNRNQSVWALIERAAREAQQADNVDL